MTKKDRAARVDAAAAEPSTGTTRATNAKSGDNASAPLGNKEYDKALKKIGIDLGMLSSEAGHA